jgi:redox-sensitive bicupin YhaK (pirin superfamily)
LIPGQLFFSGGYMKHIIHRAETRGYADHGWLQTSHIFSFAGYYNPERIRFGSLRVLNDDIVQPGKGFGSHSHENMEIISVPLIGSLAHKDSSGHETAIYPNDVQIMSAGTGITHSEYNYSETEPVNFLQIWIFPKEKNINPRYNQKTFDPEERHNRWQFMVAPEKNDDTLWINQDAYMARVNLSGGQEINYQQKVKQNGIYFFIISGQVTINNTTLNKRDGIGIVEAQNITLKSTSDSDILALEIPL